ncbi:MAG: RAD52 family DNA repair protein [Pseudomonadota bacterium]
MADGEAFIPSVDGFDDQQVAHLKMNLDPRNVKTREGMAYIEQWWAIVMANQIFGFDSWDRETVYNNMVEKTPRKIGNKNEDGWHVSYVAKVRITVYAGSKVLRREGTGFGEGIGKDLHKTHESASKEAESDAMKRALITFGNQFGLALYDKDKNFVGPPQQTEKKPAQQNKNAPQRMTKAKSRDLYTELETSLRATESLTEQTAWWTGNKDKINSLHQDFSDALNAEMRERANGYRAEEAEAAKVAAE